MSYSFNFGLPPLFSAEIHTFPKPGSKGDLISQKSSLTHELRMLEAKIQIIDRTPLASSSKIASSKDGGLDSGKTKEDDADPKSEKEALVAKKQEVEEKLEAVKRAMQELGGLQ